MTSTDPLRDSTAPASHEGAPIIRRPGARAQIPVLVSIPHFGTDCVPGVDAAHFHDPRYTHFPLGYSDPYAPEIYGNLHHCGATVVATPISRLFVDLNRPRDDFQVHAGAVRSHSGVLRTHMRDGRPMFRHDLPPSRAERRLADYYDPFHDLVQKELQRLRRDFGRAVLLDGHTTYAARLDNHEVVIGTGRGRVCSPALAEGVARIVRRHGFACSFDVSGYTGGHLVRSHGSVAGPRQAIQIEFNVGVTLKVAREAWVKARRQGARPDHDAHGLSRCIVCMNEVVAWLGQCQV